MPQPRRASPRRAPQSAAPRQQQQQPVTGASVAATSAAIAAAVAAPIAPTGAGILAPGMVPKLARAQVRALLSAVTLRLRRESIVRRRDLGAIVLSAMIEQRPRASNLERLVVARDERRREMEFRRRQILRMRRDLAKALEEEDPQRRELRVDGVLRRESHYSRLRALAVTTRAAGAAEALNVLEASPLGAVWELGPRENHCPGCAHLHGRALTWGALRRLRMIPPVGPGCGCRLRGLVSAWLTGVTAAPPTPPNDRDSELLLATAQALGHPHGHDGGVIA